MAGERQDVASGSVATGSYQVGVRGRRALCGGLLTGHTSVTHTGRPAGAGLPSTAATGERRLTAVLSPSLDV